MGVQATVIEVDPPGIGRRQRPATLRLVAHAHILSQAVRRSGDAPAVVGGHSLGGLVALRLAADDPSLAPACCSAT